MCSHVFEDPGIQNGKLKEKDLSTFPLKKCRSTMVKFLTGLSPTVNVTLRAQTCPLSQYANGGESERDHEEVQQPTHDHKKKDKTKLIRCSDVSQLQKFWWKLIRNKPPRWILTIVCAFFEFDTLHKRQPYA